MTITYGETSLLNTPLIAQLPGLFAIMDASHRHVSINQNMAELFGYLRPDDYLEAGGMIDNIHSPVVEICEGLISENRRVLTEKKSSKFLTIAIYADKQIHYLFGEKSLFQSGGKDYVIYNYQDITDLKSINALNVYALLKTMKRYGHTNICSQGSVKLEQRYEELGLTGKQSECAFLLTLGKTAREISVLLGLSKRTVEHYIENMKNKMYCHSKSELIENLVANGVANRVPEQLIDKFI